MKESTVILIGSMVIGLLLWGSVGIVIGASSGRHKTQDKWCKRVTSDYFEYIKCMENDKE